MEVFWVNVWTSWKRLEDALRTSPKTSNFRSYGRLLSKRFGRLQNESWGRFLYRCARWVKITQRWCWSGRFTPIRASCTAYICTGDPLYYLTDLHTTVQPTTERYTTVRLSDVLQGCESPVRVTLYTVYPTCTHNPAAHNRATHNYAAQWCAAGLCATRTDNSLYNQTKLHTALLHKTELFTTMSLRAVFITHRVTPYTT